MKVLVLGSGAREHALTWKLKKSPLAGVIYAWPGNPLINTTAQRLNLPADSSYELVGEHAKSLGIDLVVCGPENPLADGVVNLFEKKGLKIFGPCQEVAQLESSKAFAKKIMAEAGIPTAAFQLAQSEAECRKIATERFHRDGAVVLKASGLASGKGVFVCKNEADLEEGFRRLYAEGMHKAASTVVIEEVLYGRECSYFSFLGGGVQTSIGFAVDYKRLKPGDKGPNTGGMGCYTPVPWLPKNAVELVDQRVVRPLMQALERRGLSYRGCLYVGLMWTEKGPCVVEFNVRLGDPEAEVLVMADRRDWLKIIAQKCGIKGLSHEENGPDDHLQPTVAMVLASSSYPYGEAPDQPASFDSETLRNLCQSQEMVFGGAIKLVEGRLQTGAGRVFCAASSGESFEEARLRTQNLVRKIQAHWPASQFRPDIAEGLDRGTCKNQVCTNRTEQLQIILASSSPRRRELISSLGVDFEVLSPSIVEKIRPGEKPQDYVLRNAAEKSALVHNKISARFSPQENYCIISADTIVLLDDMVLEKPFNAQIAAEMLRSLSGKTHQVLTGVKVCGRMGGQDKQKDWVTTTKVTIRPLGEEEIHAYIRTGEPFDKSGSYAAQGLGASLISHIDGSFTNVVGLPLAELSSYLRDEFALTYW